MVTQCIADQSLTARLCVAQECLQEGTPPREILECCLEFVLEREYTAAGPLPLVANEDAIELFFHVLASASHTDALWGLAVRFHHSHLCDKLCLYY